MHPAGLSRAWVPELHPVTLICGHLQLGPTAPVPIIGAVNEGPLRMFAAVFSLSVAIMDGSAGGDGKPISGGPGELVACRRFGRWLIGGMPRGLSAANDGIACVSGGATTTPALGAEPLAGLAIGRALTCSLLGLL